MKSKYNFIFYHLLWVLSLILIYLIYLSNEIDVNSLNKIISFAFIINFVWGLISWYVLTKSIFDPYILFFIAAASFNGGQIFLEAFGLNELGFLGGEFTKLHQFLTVYYITISLALFHLGGLISFKKVALKKGKISSIFNEKNILIIGLFLLTISFIPTIIILKSSLFKVLNFGYFGLFTGKKLTGINAINTRLSLFFIPATIFILIGGKKSKGFIILSLILILTSTLIRFFIGDRSGAVLPLIAYFWTWHKVIKPIPVFLLASIGAFLLFIVFPLVSLTRNISGIYRLNFEFLKEAFLTIQNPAVSIISEMGITSITMAYTLQLVPYVEPYQLGKSYFYGFYSIIPNFFAEVHPAKAYGTPSDWLVWTVNPYFAREGGGLGYSFIAEAYLNFGWIGGLILLIILGFLTGKLHTLTLDKNRLGKIALVASFMAFYLKYARADINSVIRPLIWYAFIPYLLIYIYYLLKEYHEKYFKKYINL